MTRRDVRDRVHELIGERPKAAHRRLVINGRVAIFQDDFDDGVDIHIIPCVTINSNSDEPDVYYQDTEQVWLLRAKDLVGWRNPDVQKRMDIHPAESDKGKRYYTMPVSAFERIFPPLPETNTSSQAVENIEDWTGGDPYADHSASQSDIITKDFAALMLRYPDADSEWLNDMIREANRVQGIPNPAEKTYAVSNGQQKLPF